MFFGCSGLRLRNLEAKKDKNLVQTGITVSLADHFSDDSGSELDKARKSLEEKDFSDLIEKQGKARREITHATLCSGFQLKEYQDDVIVYLEECEDQGQEYKVGEFKQGTLDFHCEDPEPLEF